MLPDPPLIVMLTAAVSPTVATKVAITDPEVRLAQYRESLATWLSWVSDVDGAEIHLIETTGFDRERFLKGVDLQRVSPLHWHSHEPTGDANQRGKGAVELEALSSVMSESLASVPDAATVYKVTGRLRLTNPDECVRRLATNEVVARRSLDHSYFDTRILGMSLRVWRDRLLGAQHLVNDSSGVYLEHVVAARLAEPVFLGQLTARRFKVRPSFEGVSGSTGLVYRSRPGGPRSRLAVAAEHSLVGFASRKQV